MPADLVPHSAIPDLARQVTPAMVEVLEHLQRAGFLLNSRSLPAELVDLLEHLARLGLVDPGYEGDVARGAPYLWTSNGNGSRVLYYRKGIHSGPHYQIGSVDLAAWLEDQGRDRWWNVSGDPLLTGRRPFPCPADQIAAELRSINRPLLVRAKKDDLDARGQLVGKEKLDQVVIVPTARPDPIRRFFASSWTADRMLHLCWLNSLFDWALVEDGRTTELMRAEARSRRSTPVPAGKCVKTE